MKQQRLHRRSALWLAAAAAIACTVPAQVLAQDKFPSKPVEIVIHSKYGGGTDTTARMMMIRTRRILDTDMFVTSQRGGSGAKAHQYAMDKPRDGYTVLALTQTHLYTIARGKSPLTIDDIVGVARAMDDPTLITVAADSKYQTLADLVAASEEGALNWGVAQIGGTEHIGLATFAKAAGIKFKAVPFGSGAQMVQALMSGAIDATLPNVSEGGSQVNDGTFRALAVMSEKRLADFPDVPTTFEQGYDVKTSTTRGYFVLKGTPEDRVQMLSDAMVKAMQHETFANYLKSAGLTVDDSVAAHEAWTMQIREEYAIAEQALKDLGLTK